MGEAELAPVVTPQLPGASPDRQGPSTKQQHMPISVLFCELFFTQTETPREVKTQSPTVSWWKGDA